MCLVFFSLWVLREMRGGGWKAKESPNTELSHGFLLWGRWFTPFLSMDFQEPAPTSFPEGCSNFSPIVQFAQSFFLLLQMAAFRLQPGIVLTLLQVFNIEHIILYWTLKDSETVPCRTLQSHKFRWWSRVLLYLSSKRCKVSQRETLWGYSKLSHGRKLSSPKINLSCSGWASPFPSDGLIIEYHLPNMIYPLEMENEK